MSGRKPRTGIWLVVVGALSAALGLVIGLVEHGMCGSAFFPDSSVAQLRDAVSGYAGGSAAAGCSENLVAPKMFGWLFLILGIVLFTLGLVLRSFAGSKHDSQKRESGPGETGAAQRMEQLTSLRDRNLISFEEYETKRRDLLDQV